MSTGGPAAWLSSRVLLVFENVADTGDADAASCRDQGDKRQPLEEKKDANAEEEDDIMALRKSTAVRRSCRHTHVHAWSLRAYMEYVLYARVGVRLCPSASCLCPSLSRHARELRAQRSPLHRPRHPACVRSPTLTWTGCLCHAWFRAGAILVGQVARCLCMECISRSATLPRAWRVTLSCDRVVRPVRATPLLVCAPGQT